MNILALGDVVGKPGRQALREKLPGLRLDMALDFVLVNGENMAGGVGLTADTLDEVFAAGVDAITSGNHVWKHREVFSRLDVDRRVLRPANYPDFPTPAPGRGSTVLSLPDGRRVALLNLQGTTFMDALPCPFQAALNQVCCWDEDQAPAVRLVDFHAEATSEKKALGWALDGRVSAVLGTHTHVQTADAYILPNGTAYLTDLGMCGVEPSALGMDAETVLAHFLSRRPVSFKPAKGRACLTGAVLDIDDETGLARNIRLFREDCPSGSRL